MWTKQNYHFYTEQLLFGTLLCTRVLYTFIQNYYYLIIKLQFWKQKRTIGSYTNKKVLFSRDSPCFSPAFLLLMKPFFFKSLAQLDTDSLFATIPMCYSLFGVACTKVVECLCTQFVKCNTGVILSPSTSTWQPLCASHVLPVG